MQPEREPPKPQHRLPVYHGVLHELLTPGHAHDLREPAHRIPHRVRVDRVPCRVRRSNAVPIQETPVPEVVVADVLRLRLVRTNPVRSRTERRCGSEQNVGIVDLRFVLEQFRELQSQLATRPKELQRRRQPHPERGRRGVLGHEVNLRHRPGTVRSQCHRPKHVVTVHQFHRDRRRQSGSASIERVEHEP